MKDPTGCVAEVAGRTTAVCDDRVNPQSESPPALTAMLSVIATAISIALVIVCDVGGRRWPAGHRHRSGEAGV